MIEIDEFKNLRKLQYEEEKTQAEKLREQVDLFDASNLLRIFGTPILIAIDLLYRDGLGLLVLILGSVLMIGISICLLFKLPDYSVWENINPEVSGDYAYANIVSMTTVLAIIGFEILTPSKTAMQHLFLINVIFLACYLEMMFHASNRFIRRWSRIVSTINYAFVLMMIGAIIFFLPLTIIGIRYFS